MQWDREKERNAAKKMGIGVSIFAIVFAVFWCIMAASMGAWFMLLFGIPFAGLLVYRLIIMLRLTRDDTPKQPRQEIDPWDRPAANHSSENCPYCGFRLEQGFEFCPKCGRRL